MNSKLFLKFFSCTAFLFVGFLFFSPNSAEAANRYWVGSSGGNTNDNANWASSDPASCTGGGATAPGSSDVAIFDADCDNDATINATFNVLGVSMVSGYTGTVTQASGVVITVGTTDWLQVGGTFTGSDGAINFNDAFSVTGGIFNATTGLITSLGAWTVNGGTFNHINGSVKFGDAAHTITGSHTLYNVEFNASASNRTFTVAAGTTLTIAATFTISGTANISIVTGTINAQGDITITNTGSAASGTATININGTETQTLTGSGVAGQGRLPNVTINKSSGTLNLASVISVVGTSWTWTAGTIDAGSSTIYFTNTDHTITGSHTLNALEFTNDASARTLTIASGTILTLNGTLTLSGIASVSIGTGDIYAKGDVTITNSATVGGGSGTITLNGTGTQTITGQGTGGQGRLPNIVINKASGTLNLASVISVAGNWTWTAGTIDAGSSTVYFTNTSHTITGSHTLNALEFTNDASIRTLTIASGTILTLNGTLTLSGASSASIATGDIYAKGDVTITNSGTGGGGSGTITLNGTGTQTITGQGTGGQGRLPNIVINKASGTLNLASVISVAGNWTWTAGTIDAGSSTLYFSTTGSIITGSHTINNLTFENGASSKSFTIASGTILTVSGTLTTIGTSSLTLNTGDIYAQGDIVAGSNTGGGTATITINGTGTQTFTGSGTEGAGRLPAIIINKPSGTLNLASIITSANNWTYTAGTINAGTSEVYFYTTATISGSHTLNNVSFNNGGTSATFTLSGSTVLTITGTLTTAGSAALAFNTGTINAQGDVNLTHSGTTSGTATFVLNGSAAQTFSKAAATFSIPITINKTNQTDTVTLGSDVAWTQNFTVTSGTFRTGGFNLTGAPTKTFTLSSGASFEMSGNSNYPTTFTTYTYDSNSTVRYLQNQAKTITNATYGNLTLAPSAAVTFTLPATVTTIPGNLVIGDGSNAGIINADTNDPSFTVRGNLTINANAVFTKGSGTLTLASGTGSQTWTDSTSGQDLGAVVVASNSTNTTVTLSGSPSATSLTINSSQIVSADSSTLTLTGTGTALSASGTFTASTGTVSYTGATANLSAITYNNLTLGVGTYTAPSSTMTLTGNYTNGGTFTHNSGTFVIAGSGTSVLSGATTFYNFTANTSGKTLNFTAGQTFRINGLLTLANVTLGSTSGSQWFINHQGTESVSSLTLSNSGCDAGSTDITVTSSTAGSNNGTCWVFPATTPDAPTIGTATAGNTDASVTFSAPASDGGSAITTYAVTSSPGSFVGYGSASPITVSGLTNGTAYTFTVTATNAVGTSTASSASNSVTPSTVASVPQNVSIIGSAGQADVTWEAPSSTGGSAITGYKVYRDTTVGATTLVATLGVVLTYQDTSVSNGTRYYYRVKATNGTGDSSYSSEASVVVGAVSSAPTNLAGTVNSSSIDLSWSAPSSSNGGAVFDYLIEYQLTTGGTWSTFNDGVGVGTTKTVTGLSNSNAYDFRVSAVNSVGTSTAATITNITPGEPAQVAIQSFAVTETPSIQTNVRITNEGLIAYEYQYTWCVTDASNNSCGGGNDVFSSTAAKLIQAGVDFDTTLSSTVSSAGSYYFHIEVTYGSASSTAVQSFAVTAPASSGGSSGGGGGGGGSGSYVYVPIVPVGTVVATTTTPVVVPSLATSTTPQNSGYIFVRDLSSGMLGNDVMQLQKFLNTHGFKVAITGPGSLGNETEKFGAGTRTALSSFQVSQGISPSSGYFGPLTRFTVNRIVNGLVTVVAPVTTTPTVPINTPAPSTSGTVTIKKFTKVLEFGMVDDEVKQLQIFLNKSGFAVANSGVGSPGFENRSFGPATKAALINFQNAYAAEILFPQGLSAGTGKFGGATRVFVNELLRTSM